MGKSPGRPKLPATRTQASTMLRPEILSRARERAAAENRSLSAMLEILIERALEEGFKDRKRILDDLDFQKISSDPAFVALMKNPPVAIKD